MANESEEDTWSGSEEEQGEEEDVREILIEKMEEHDPNIFSINFDDLEGFFSHGRTLGNLTKFTFLLFFVTLSSDFKKIGEGNFGRIWRGDYLGTTVAVKQLLDVDDEDMHKYIEREMLTLRQMRHPNILQVSMKDTKKRLFLF
jgi:hypothetical protein